jgi:hypothetical protein
MMDVKDIACGYGFTVFAVNNKNGQLMGTGINKDGQIGKMIRLSTSLNGQDELLQIDKSNCPVYINSNKLLGLINSIPVYSDTSVRRYDSIHVNLDRSVRQID